MGVGRVLGLLVSAGWAFWPGLLLLVSAGWGLWPGLLLVSAGLASGRGCRLRIRALPPPARREWRPASVRSQSPNPTF